MKWEDKNEVGSECWFFVQPSFRFLFLWSRNSNSFFSWPLYPLRAQGGVGGVEPLPAASLQGPERANRASLACSRCLGSEGTVQASTAPIRILRKAENSAKKAQVASVITVLVWGEKHFLKVEKSGNRELLQSREPGNMNEWIIDRLKIKRTKNMELKLLNKM